MMNFEVKSCHISRCLSICLCPHITPKQMVASLLSVYIAQMLVEGNFDPSQVDGRNTFKLLPTVKLPGPAV